MSTTHPMPPTKTGDVDYTRVYLAFGRIDRVIRRDSASAPLGSSGLSALSTIVHGGPLRLSELAASEGVAKPSMTRIVADLEDLGAVRRTPDPTDGRAFLVRATRRGRTMIEAGRAGRTVALRRRMERLQEHERATVLAALPALEALVEYEED